MLEFSHKPVMLEECMQGLALKEGGVWFDGTVGGGGHSFEILKRTSPSGRLIATDLDDEAIEASTKRLSSFTGRFEIHKSNYSNRINQTPTDFKLENLSGLIICLLRSKSIIL